MTRPSKKSYERHLVQEAAKRLKRSWTLDDNREHPDFVVTDGTQKFGLEVCEIFTGKETRSGSMDKRGESDTQSMINAIRRKYETIQNIQLSVKLVGDTCAENIAKVVPALVTKNLASAPVGYQLVVDIDTGLRAGLRVYVMKSLQADWFNVKDRVGWVDHDPMRRIVATVEKKSQELARYMKYAGSDIRLLIVANRIHNSGKLALEEQTQLDKKGFNTVYFFSYPESVVVFD